MATEKKDLIMNLERVVTMPIRISYRFARDHFLVFSSVIFMLILYSSFPSLFAFMVSTSPILICTTLLLGLLLSYGESNAPQIQIKNDEKIQEVFPLNSLATANDFRTKKFVNFQMGYRAVDRPDIKESSKAVYMKEEALYVHGKKYSETITANLSGNNEKEAVPYEQELTQEGALQSEKLLKIREIHLQKRGEVSEELGTNGAFSAVDKDESQSPMLDIHDGFLHLPWEGINDLDMLGSESYITESSSDASMTKINKILDKFDKFDRDPLLNEESPRPVPEIKDDADAASQRSSLVDDSDGNSDDGVESLEGVEDEVQKQKADGSEVAVKWIADDQKNVLDIGYSDLERNKKLMILIAKRQAKKSASIDNSNLIDFGIEDEVQKQKGDGSEAAVKWTADDQKNFMDLGYSEAERDARLRILIAKHQAKKSMSLDHSNLIDVGDDWELSCLHFGIPPISVPRHNPFDISSDFEETKDFPHIPGSAPLFAPSRKTFDILWDREDEYSNLLVSETQRNSPAHETILRRNETFTLSRRQFSDQSDLMVSEDTESDSVSSLGDLDYKKEQEEEDIFVDVEEEDEQHETRFGEDSLSNVVKNDSAQAFSALPVQEVSNVSMIDEASYLAGQIGKAGADSTSRSLKEDSTANRVFTGLQSIDRTESLDSTGYESLSELHPGFRCMSSSNLSDVFHPMNQRADEVDDQILSELDMVGDFHPHPYLHIEPRTQTPEVRSITYDNASGNSVSQVDYHKPSQEDSISIHHQKILESGVAFTFGSFGEFEQTVYNPKQRVLQLGSFQADLQTLKNAAIKSDHESSKTGSTSRHVEEELPASKLVVDQTHSDLYVLDVRPFENMHFPSKQVSDTTDDEASKATESMEVGTVKSHLNPDVPEEQYINDESLQYKESISKEANSEGDKQNNSGYLMDHHISTTKKIYKVIGNSPSVNLRSHQIGGAVQPKTGNHTARAKMDVGAPTSQASAVTRPNKRGTQKVIQLWKRVSHAVLQENQDVEPNAEAISNTGSQQKNEVPLVHIPREEAISCVISPQQDIHNSVDSPRDHMTIPDKVMQQQEIPSVNIPVLSSTSETLIVALDDQHQEDAYDNLPELPDYLRQISDILELPPSVVMENDLLIRTEKDGEKYDPQQQEEKTKKKKKKKSSKNTRNYCFHCGEPDHQRDSCPLGAPVCYHCSQTGHGFKECPKKLQEEANNEIQMNMQQEALFQEDAPSSNLAI